MRRTTGKLVLKCRHHMDTPLQEHMGALGLSAVGSMVPPLMPAAEPRQEFRWWTPDQPEPVVQVRPGRHGKYDTPAGAKMKRCLFPGPVPAGSAPIIVSEGAKASMHAAGKSGLPAVRTLQRYDHAGR